MIILKSKKTNKIVVASDNPNVIRDYIINRYNKAFELFKNNAVIQETMIDGFPTSLDYFNKSIDVYRPNVIVWYNVYKQFLNVCPTSHVQKSIDFAETEEYIIQKVEIDF